MYGPSIQNLIFDLGGVILNLDVPKTHAAFAKLAGISQAKMKQTHIDSAFFDLYEKGMLTDEEFRLQLRSILGVPVTDSQIDEAWNAMLLSIPVERLQLLERLAKKHRIFLLSNTNNIHLQFFNGIVRATAGHESLAPFFEKDYYSHLLKMRKPDVEIFEYVLRENNLIPGETLFLDDNVDNLKGAELAGMKTAHVTHPDMIFSILK